MSATFEALAQRYDQFFKALKTMENLASAGYDDLSIPDVELFNQSFKLAYENGRLFHKNLFDLPSGTDNGNQ